MKKLFSLLLAAALLLAVSAFAGCGDRDKKEFAPGTEENPWQCGATDADAVCAFLMDDSLWINGSGRMADYEDLSERPWNDVADRISGVYIFDSLDYVGKNAFKAVGGENDAGYVDLFLSSGIVEIGESAFEGVFFGDDAYLSFSGTEVIGARAFADATFGTAYFYTNPTAVAADAFAGVTANVYTVFDPAHPEAEPLAYGGTLTHKLLYTVAYTEDYGTEDVSGCGSWSVPEDELFEVELESSSEDYHFVRYEVISGDLAVTDPTNPEISAKLTGNVELVIVYAANEK